MNLKSTLEIYAGGPVVAVVVQTAVDTEVLQKAPKRDYVKEMDDEVKTLAQKLFQMSPDELPPYHLDKLKQHAANNIAHNTLGKVPAEY